MNRPAAKVRLVRPTAQRTPHRLILRAGECVGELEIDRYPRQSREKAVAFFGGKPSRVFPLLDKLGVPERFNVAWVFDLRVPAKLRGQGIARQAMATLFANSPGLILLEVGAATGTRMAQRDRRKVYRRLGFTLFKANGMELGMRWDDPKAELKNKPAARAGGKPR